jgi:hypothetical protein
MPLSHALRGRFESPGTVDWLPARFESYVINSAARLRLIASYASN